MSKLVANPAAIRAIIEGRPDLVGSQVCIAANMSHGHLSNAMAGRKPLSEEKLHALAAAMGVPVEAISYTASVCTCAEPVAV